MMSLFGQGRNLISQKLLFVAVIKTSGVLFLLFCCRYLDSFIDMYHVISGFISCHQLFLDLMEIRRNAS